RKKIKGNTTAGEKNKLCCIIQILRGRRKIDSPGRQFWKAGQEEKRYDQDCGSRRGRGPRAHRKAGTKVRLFCGFGSSESGCKGRRDFRAAGAQRLREDHGDQLYAGSSEI